MDSTLNAVFLALCAPLVTAAAPDFGDPALVGDAIDDVLSLELVVDGGSNAFVAASGREGGGDRAIYYANSLNGFSTVQRIGVDGASCARPSLALGALGGIDILFEAHMGADADLYYVTNRGGPFQAPEPVAATSDRELFPLMWAPSGTGVMAVWEVEDPGGGRRLVQSAGLGSPVTLAEGGEHPEGCLSPVTERFHLVHLSGSDLVYRAEGKEALAIASNVPADSSYDIMATSLTDSVHVAFATPDGIMYSYLRPEGVFSAPTLVAASAGAPGLAEGPGGSVWLTYIAAGDVWLRIGSGGEFGDETRLTTTPDPETEATLAIDQAGYFHMLSVLGGRLWYRSSVPAPRAGFSASSQAGEVPLLVRFKDESQGPVRARTWDLGDGTTSNARDPEHVYETPGDYTVSLRVIGPGGQDEIVKERCIAATPARNVLSIPEIKVWAGQGGVRHPVYAIHPEPLHGFQIALAYRDEYLDGFEVSLEDTSLAALTPELIAPSLTEGPDGEKHFVIGVVIDIDPPYDGRTLAAAPNEDILAFLTYNVRISAPFGQRIPLELRNGIGSPPLNNTFTVLGAHSVLPRLEGGGAMIDRRPACLFQRGDGNFDGSVNIGDAIFTLSYLFARASTPRCLDACDSNDSGLVDIADAIFVLSFLFGSGSVPRYPFPVVGLDPTEDEYTVCDCPPR